MPSSPWPPAPAILPRTTLPVRWSAYDTPPAKTLPHLRSLADCTLPSYFGCYPGLSPLFCLWMDRVEFTDIVVAAVCKPNWALLSYLPPFLSFLIIVRILSPILFVKGSSLRTSSPPHYANDGSGDTIQLLYKMYRVEYVASRWMHFFFSFLLLPYCLACS